MTLTVSGPGEAPFWFLLLVCPKQFKISKEKGKKEEEMT